MFLRVAISTRLTNVSITEFSQVVLEGLEGSTDFSLNATAVGLQTRVFGSVIPAGRYRVKGMVASAGAGAFTSRIDLSSLGTFRVKEGSLTDLGAFFVTTHPQSKIPVTVRVQPEDRDFLLKTYFSPWPTLPVVTWEDPSPDGKHPEAGDQGTLLNRPIEGPDGKVYAGGRFGRVHVRSGPGQWAAWDTGSAHEVLSVALDGARCVAAGESGLLALTKDGGRHWNQLPFPPGVGSLFFIGKTTQSWMGVGVDGPDLVAFSTPDIESPTWTLLSRFKGALAGKRLQLRTDGLSAALTPQALVIGVAPRTLHRLDLKTSEWTQVPMAADITTLDGTLDGTLILRGEKPLQMSTDQGRTWAPVDTPRYALCFQFLDKSRGYALQRPMFGGRPWLTWTQDGGRTWQQSKPVPKYCEDLIVLKDGKEFLAFYANDLVYRSLDLGQTWELDRTFSGPAVFPPDPKP